MADTKNGGIAAKTNGERKTNSQAKSAKHNAAVGAHGLMSAFSLGGISQKLFTSIGMIVLFTVVAISLSVLVFRDVQNEFEKFNNSEVPSLVSSSELAFSSTDAAIAATRVVNATDESSRSLAMSEAIVASSSLISGTREAGSMNRCGMACFAPSIEAE